MSTLRAYLGVEGLTDVGLRFYTQNTPVGARITAGMTDEGAGWYSFAGQTLAGDHVRWDSTGTAAAIAREDISQLIMVQQINALISGGLLPVDVKKINSSTVNGTGISVDKWRGA